MRIECLDCHDGKQNHCEGCNLFNMSLDIRKYIDALEKQIPKKPMSQPTDEYAALCPCCYEEVLTHWIHGGISYCEECGQAIDWRSE